VAYLVANPDAAPAPGQLREFLRVKVPDYMVPAAFMLMEALPLTPSGKVDRQALPVPDRVRPEVEFVAPRTPIEAALAEIWAQLLGVDRIGVNDSFFDLGGHSLLATQLVSQVRETFSVELPLRRLFETPTVAALADAVSQSQFSGEKPDGSKIERLQRGEQSLEELVAELEQLSAEKAQALLTG
jgi:acyl carrier protein